MSSLKKSRRVSCLQFCSSPIPLLYRFVFTLFREIRAMVFSERILHVKITVRLLQPRIILWPLSLPAYQNSNEDCWTCRTAELGAGIHNHPGQRYRTPATSWHRGAHLSFDSDVFGRNSATGARSGSAAIVPSTVMPGYLEIPATVVLVM